MYSNMDIVRCAYNYTTLSCLFILCLLFILVAGIIIMSCNIATGSNTYTEPIAALIILATMCLYCCTTCLCVLDPRGQINIGEEMDNLI